MSGQLSEVLRTDGIRSSFIQVHQSFVVNYDYVQKLGYQQLALADGTEIAISYPYHRRAERSAGVGGAAKGWMAMNLWNILLYVVINAIHIYTGNSAVDNILNYKLSEAEAMGVSLKEDVAIPAQLPVKPFGISAILGNLLDIVNEALRQIGKKLNLQLYADRGALHINRGNAYNGKVKKLLQNGREVYATGKEQPELHSTGEYLPHHRNYHGTMGIDIPGNGSVSISC